MPEPLADLSSNTDANPDANPNADTSAITKANASTETSVDASTDADPIVQITLTEPEKDVVPGSELMPADAAPDAPKIDTAEWALEETLANHKEWLDSHAATGGKADLRKAQLEDHELIGVNLRHADLQED